MGKKLTRVAWCILKRALGARFFAERKSKTPPRERERDIGAPGGSSRYILSIACNARAVTHAAVSGVILRMKYN